MSYPEDLKVSIKRLNNYSRSSVKIHNQYSGDVVGGGELIFTLPQNSLVNLSDFAIHMNLSTNVAGLDSVSAKVGYYPCRNLSVIRRMTVNINGQTVSSIDGYDRIRDFLLNYTLGESNEKFALYGNSDPSKLYDSNDTYRGFKKNATLNDVGFNDRIVLNRWIAWLASRPSFIDTSIFGTVTLSFLMSPSEDVLFRGEGTVATVSAAPIATYSDIHATITKVQIEDGFYYQSIQSGLAQNIPFKMMFHDFQTVNGSAAGLQNSVTRIEVQSGSIDLAFFSYVPATYKQTTSSSAMYLGNALDKEKPWTKNDDVTKLGLNNHTYFRRSLEYVDNLVWNVNGQNVPNYNMNKHHIYTNLLSDLGINSDREGGMYEGITSSRYSWEKYFGVATCRLSHVSGDPEFISGMSSEGVPVSITVTTQNAGGNSSWIPALSVMTTRQIEVYAGRNVILMN